MHNFIRMDWYGMIIITEKQAECDVHGLANIVEVAGECDMMFHSNIRVIHFQDI